MKSYMESSIKPATTSIDDLALVKDAYNIFIDSGSSPDTYLSPDFNQIFNNSSSLYFNGSFDETSNSTPIFTRSNINDTNNSETYTNIPGEEVTELVIMAVTSIILGLVILITVIVICTKWIYKVVLILAAGCLIFQYVIYKQGERNLAKIK